MRWGTLPHWRSTETVKPAHEGPNGITTLYVVTGLASKMTLSA